MIIPQQLADDETDDLLEIDLNHPEQLNNGEQIGTKDFPTVQKHPTNDTISQTSTITQRPKELRDQTTNTVPLSERKSSNKSKKKVKRKSPSTTQPITSNSNSPTTVFASRLQKVDKVRIKFD